MKLQELVVQEGVLGIVIGTIIGTATTNFFKSFRETLFSQNKNMKSELLSIIVEFGLSMIIIYLLYVFIIHPFFAKQLNQRKIEQEKDAKWKQEIADDVDMINQRMLVSGNSVVFQ